MNPFSEQKYIDILVRNGCSENDIKFLMEAWMEPHRVYHDTGHLSEILKLVENLHTNGMPPDEYEMYVLCAIFHDAVYNPKSTHNEDESAELFRKMCTRTPPAVFSKVYAMILDTKDHSKPASSKKSDRFFEMDLHTLINGTLHDMIKMERKVFREYGFVDFQVYHAKRLEILRELVPYIKSKNPASKLDVYIQWLECYKPNIAVFPGVFGAKLHARQTEILDKAERIFDKVILATNITNFSFDLVKGMPLYQIQPIESVSSMRKVFKYPVVIVRDYNDNNLSEELDALSMPAIFIK